MSANSIPEAMSANSMPSGSTLKASCRPGITVNSDSSGRAPPTTIGSSVSTQANSAIEVIPVIVSRRLGSRPAHAISTAPTAGNNSASATVCPAESINGVHPTDASLPEQPIRP